MLPFRNSFDPTPTPSPNLPFTLTPEQSLDFIRNLIPFLILSCLTVKSFPGRWQIIKTRLDHLKKCITQISESTHWSENPLIQELLPKLLTTLNKTKNLSDQCHDLSFHGKLLMQSDLDMASSSLSLHLHDLDLLIKSGVLQHSNAIVVPWPNPGSSKEDLGFFIRDLFARLQIGSIDFKKKALESLIQLLEQDDKNSILVSKEGDINYLIHLLDSNNGFIREQAVISVAILANTDCSRQTLFAEGSLGPLVRLLEMGSSVTKEKAATAIEALTSDSENAWAISAYGGIPALINICRTGSPIAQTRGAGALRNVAVVEDIRTTMAEEGAIPVLVNLLVSGTGLSQEHAAECLHILASSDEKMRGLIVKEGGLQGLLQLLQEPTSPKAQEHVVRAIYSLSSSISTARILSSCNGFLKQLVELIKSGQSSVQQLAASAICNLSLSNESKKAFGEAGCIGALVKMLESKPACSQELAAQALSSLLVVEANRKEFVKDEKSVSKLVQMLDPKNMSVSKKYPLSVLLLVSTSRSCRKRIAAVGACQHLQKLAEMEVAGAKKILHRIAGGRFRNIFTRAIWRD